MSFIRRTLLVAVAIAVVTSGGVAAVAVLTATDSGSPTAPPSAATTVRYYEPWVGGKPAAGLHVVAASGDANCWEGSLESPRPDAYRCSTRASYEGGNLFDPCFASPTDVHRMMCPTEPLSAHRVVAVTSTKPALANDGPASTAGNPWDVELAGGVTCRAVSGAAAFVAGVRANYDCPRGWILWGDPNRSKPRWTIRSSASDEPVRFDTTTIAVAWF